MRILLCSLLFGLSLPVHAQELRVLTTELPPFFYLEGGKPAGIEYEILSYHAKSAGLELNIRWLAHWPELFPALEDGKGDIVAAGAQATLRFRDPALSGPHAARGARRREYP